MGARRLTDSGTPRRPKIDELVWHKLVDAIGELALVGRPVRGHLIIDRPSHALHHPAVRTFLGN